MSTPQKPEPDAQPTQNNPIPQQPAQGQLPDAQDPEQLAPLSSQPAVMAQRPWYKQKRFSVPLAAVAIMAVLGLGASLGRSTATPAGKPAVSAASATATATAAAALSLSQSCTNVTKTVQGVLDFGYDDDADADTAANLAANLRQNVAPSPNSIHNDIALLIANLDEVQTATMKVADFTEPADRILTSCDVDYTSPNDPLADSADDPTDDPTTAPAPKKESKFDKLSAEQQDAYGSAQDYLGTQGFSKDGLIDQLSSKYGSNYDKKDAKKAVDALDEDWNKQAVRAAKSYRETMHFSTNELIEQLESDYGSQFTHSQAVYGAKHSR